MRFNVERGLCVTTNQPERLLERFHPSALTPTHRRVAIIGAGFSGTVVAAHLQRHHGPAPLHIIQINRSGRIARGVAYGTRSSEHVLNVPAGRMSASLLKGKYWEATAVPELRVHAARVAARILSVVGRERTPAVA